MKKKIATVKSSSQIKDADPEKDGKNSPEETTFSMDMPMS